ncbi:MAG TPA: ROK family protein [Myxococcales bacterium]|nr:ROK family protein [Myxococcales bacterium]
MPRRAIDAREEKGERLVAIGIDLGGTSARAAVVDAAGKVRGAAKRVHDLAGPERMADILRELALEALGAAKVPESDVAAVGVGLAGQIHTGTGVVAVGPNLGWRQVPFGRLLRERLRWPVLVMNDLSAAAWGERAAGAGEGQDHVVLFFVGSGVGSALILDGRLYEGATGVAGEIGHIKVVPGGRLCGCGERGCLEAYCGGANLSAQVAEAVSAGRATTLAVGAAGGRRVTAAEIEQAALRGDSLARELWDRCASLLPLAVANLSTVLNPAKVLLGGGVLATAPELKKVVREEARRLTLAAARETLQITDALLGDDAGVVGAATRALESAGRLEGVL